MYTYTHIHQHIYAHTGTRTHRHPDAHTCVYTRTRVCMYMGKFRGTQTLDVPPHFCFAPPSRLPHPFLLSIPPPTSISPLYPASLIFFSFTSCLSLSLSADCWQHPPLVSTFPPEVSSEV